MYYLLRTSKAYLKVCKYWYQRDFKDEKSPFIVFLAYVSKKRNYHDTPIIRSCSKFQIHKNNMFPIIED